MTKGELAEIKLGGATYDVALPQPWVDNLLDELIRRRLPYDYNDITGGFVWLYDEKAAVFGRPYPLTDVAVDILERVYSHLATGNSYG